MLTTTRLFSILYGHTASKPLTLASMVCDGVLRAGQAHVLDEAYANCVDQTSSHMFYAIAAAKNLLIYGTGVSNAFTKAPPPKQGFISTQTALLMIGG